MFVTKQNKIAVLLFTWFAVFACFEIATAAPSQRGLLTVQGQITNDAGQPLADAWIYTKGTRRLSTYSQRDGHYALSIPGATLRELIRAPFKLEVHARRKSWNVLHANGPALLALEMYVESDSLGGLELNIRSNDPEAAMSVAKAAVLDANPRVVISVNFDARPGVQWTERDGRLAAIERVRLAGLTLEEVDPVTTRKLSAASQRSKRWSPVPAHARAAVPRTPAAATIETTTIDLSGEPTALAMTRLEQADGPTRNEEIARATYVEHMAGERAAPTKFARLAEGAGFATGRLASNNQTSSTDTARNQATRSEPRAASPADAEPTPALASSPASESSTFQVDIDVTPRSTPPVSASAAAVGQPQRLIPPKSRSRWTPARETASTCECTIRGTVETSRPLSKGMRVTVWIEDAPQSQATVELFMGSPRGFQLGPISCGEHRILFSPASRKQYRLDPEGDRIDCRGGVHHVRLVLIEDSSIR